MANLFRALTDTIDTMGAIEDFLMQGKVSQLMHSKLVKELATKEEEI